MYKTQNRQLRIFLPILLAVSLVTALGATLANSASQDVEKEIIGKVLVARGDVSAIGETGEQRKLKRRQEVLRGDTVTTGAKSKILIRLKDKSKFELGAESEMKFSEFVFKESEEEDKVVADVAKGVFRFVTGQVAKKKPSSMKVRTPVATLGVRGTHVLGEIDGESATIILMEPEDGEERKTAIEVANNAGAVVIDEQGYGTYIADADTAPTAPRRMRARTITNLMRSIGSVQRIPSARPRF